MAHSAVQISLGTAACDSNRALAITPPPTAQTVDPDAHTLLHTSPAPASVPPGNSPSPQHLSATPVGSRKIHSAAPTPPVSGSLQVSLPQHRSARCISPAAPAMPPATP